jgi:LPS-assembly protein
MYRNKPLKKFKLSWRYVFTVITSLGMLSSGHADTSVQNYSPAETADALGWLNKPGTNICNGYYIDPDLHSTDTSMNMQDVSTSTTNIAADSGDLHNTGISTLSGNVSIEQTGRLIQGQQAQIDRDANNQKINSIELKDRVIVKEPSRVMVGDHAKIYPNSQQGVYDNAIYRMALGFQPIQLKKMVDGSYKVNGLVAQGNATQIHQTKKGYVILKDANYSTCSPLNTSWHIRAKQIDLNRDTGRGHAKHAVIFFRSIPVFYTPYLSFPIDKRRESGFLIPTYSNSKLGGIGVGIPYYWNMAPNYDMTITPTWYSKRNLYLTTKNRVLTEHSNGELDLGGLPNDLAFAKFQQNALSDYGANPANQPELSRLENASDARWYYHLKDVTNFTPQLQGKVDATKVTDDYFQQDFNLPSQVSGQLLQQGALLYSSQYWSAQLLAQKYQTLHPVTMLANANQYSRLPDLSFNLNYPTSPYISYLFNGETVDFSRDLNPGETFNSASGEPTSGLRTNAEPGISTHWGNSYSFIKPTLQWDTTEYNLSNQMIGNENTITRSLPIFDIDSGLFFDRDVSWLGKEYDQTLEPRIYYLYVPYRTQNQIPLFDTALQTFTFNQLFQTNRFTSIDRIGDANQVSVALSTKFINADTGVQQSELGIGRIYYRRNRDVALCSEYGCQDSQYTVGSLSPTESASPLVGFANYALNKNWTTTANLAWDPATHQTNNGNFNFQYKPATNHIINLGYNYVQFGDPYTPPTTNPLDARNNLSQLTASTAWPLTQKIDGLASWNYNISHKHFQTYLYGLGYNTCCYATEIALSRTFYALSGSGEPLFNRQIIFEFVLKGLGGVNQNSSLSTIGTSIPGYQDTSNQNVY